MKEQRQAAGITQREVALKAGYGSSQFVSNVERNMCQPPIKMLKVMAKLYRIPPGPIIAMILDNKEKELIRELKAS